MSDRELYSYSSVMNIEWGLLSSAIHLWPLGLYVSSSDLAKLLGLPSIPVRRFWASCCAFGWIVPLLHPWERLRISLESVHQCSTSPTYTTKPPWAIKTQLNFPAGNSWCNCIPTIDYIFCEVDLDQRHLNGAPCRWHHLVWGYDEGATQFNPRLL